MEFCDQIHMHSKIVQICNTCVYCLGRYLHTCAEMAANQLALAGLPTGRVQVSQLAVCARALAEVAATQARLAALPTLGPDPVTKGFK